MEHAHQSRQSANRLTSDAMVSALEPVIQTAIAKDLTPLEQRILQAAWDQDSYSTVAQELYLTEGHVKDVASDLWKRLGTALGLKLSKRTFRGLIEQHWGNRSREKSAIPLTGGEQPSVFKTTVSWADAPAVDQFYGRDAEQALLKQWILDDRCRLVTVVGLGGIGKTALATQVGRAIASEFEAVIWRSLINAPSVGELLRQLIPWIEQSVGSTPLTREDTPHSAAAHGSQLEGSFEVQWLRLLDTLQHHRCLIILDNGETLLAGRGEHPYRSGSDLYDQLFQRLGDAPHQSCLLLTSREKPPAIARLDGPTSPVRTLSLTGLDTAHAQQMLERLHPWAISAQDRQQLVEHYQGHPLVLELVAKHIEEAFLGDVPAFLRQDRRLFGDLEQLLQWHFGRLSPAEQSLLFWLAVHRHPVSLPQLQRCILHNPERANLGSTLQRLQRKWPLLRHQQSVALQPVLLEFVTERLVTELSQGILQGNWERLDAICLLQASAPEERRRAQQRVILHSVRDRCLIHFHRQSLVDYLLGQLTDLQQAQRQGYAAGNLINLAIALDPNLNQRDFSGLTLREVNFQGCTLQSTNFSHSHFDRVTFTQPLQGILAVAASESGNWLAASSSDGTIQLYRADTTEHCRTLTASDGSPWIYGLAFHPNGNILVSSGVDKALCVWHCGTGERLQQQFVENVALTVAFDPVGRRWITGHRNGQIYCWAVMPDGQPHLKTPLTCWTAHPSAIWSLAVGSSYWVTRGENGELRGWDGDTDALRMTFPQQSGRIRAIAVNAEADCIAITADGEDSSIQLWQGSTGTLRATLYGHDAAVQSLGFHPSKPWLISVAHDGTIRVWNIETESCLTILHSSGSQRLEVMALAGDRLIVGGKDQTLQFWDIATERCLRSLQGFVCGTKALAFADGGNTLLSSGLDHYIWQWDLRSSPSATPPQALQGHRSNVWAIAVGTAGQRQYLASGDYGGTVRLWELKTQQIRHCWTAHPDRIRAIAVAHHREWVATASTDGVIKLWDAATGHCLRTLQGHCGAVQSLGFLTHTDQLVSCGNDGTLRLWDGLSGELLAKRENRSGGLRCLAVHPTRSHCVTGDDQGQLQLWHLTTGKAVVTDICHNNLIWSVAFSPDGQWLASGSQDCTLKLWRVNDGLQITLAATFLHSAAIGAVAFAPTCSPDNPTLIGGCFDETLHVYDVIQKKRRYVLTIPRPYEGMVLRGATGLTTPQLETLHRLGTSL